MTAHSCALVPQPAPWRRHCCVPAGAFVHYAQHNCYNACSSHLTHGQLCVCACACIHAVCSAAPNGAEELEKEACFILGLLAVKPEYQSRIARCNALPGLVRLLREHAADALTNLAHENVEIKNMVRAWAFVRGICMVSCMHACITTPPYQANVGD